MHHGNTKKIVEAMASVASADLIDIIKNEGFDVSDYDVIGFASGVYFQTLHEKIKNYIEETDFKKEQRVFLACTCGFGYRDYTKGIKKKLKRKNIQCIGSFQCKGWDTYGIFRKFGGIAKGHPNDKDLKNAQEFALKMMQKQGK